MFPARRWLVSCTLLAVLASAAARSFTIDYEHDTFLKDGQPIQIVSGSIHYFRVHPTDWADRLYKLRYAGFNTVQTYIEWASHEPTPGEYDFDGFLDLAKYLQTAQDQDLLVILRPGPYIDSERDMGGLPYWLLKSSPGIQLRTMDPNYLTPVESWMKKLLSVVKPFLYSQGGPVVMVQVENEYGSYEACDFEYMSYLRDLFRQELGEDVILHSTDGDATSYLKCGKIPGVYATVDFGTQDEPSYAFKAQRLFEPQGPSMNSEFYPGWIDHWGEAHSTVSTEAVTSSLDKILSLNASVNMYPAHGGTSFGLRTGANLDCEVFDAQVTSYDFDCPISEAGDLTDKYFAVRDVIGKYLPLPSMTAPTNSSKSAYGDVTLHNTGALFDLISTLPKVNNSYTLSFEHLDLSSGVVVYETILKRSITDPSEVSFPAVGDRGYIYLDGLQVGQVDRHQNIFGSSMFARSGQKLSIVLESQGRIAYGQFIKDFKGLSQGVYIGGTMPENWSHSVVDLEHLSKLKPHLQMLSNSLSEVTMPNGQLTFYSGTLSISGEPQDTFLKLDGWTKGVAYINDFCIGRYWPVMGPQITLYVPHGLLKTGDNSVTVFELETAPCTGSKSCTVTFTDKHEIDGQIS